MTAADIDLRLALGGDGLDDEALADGATMLGEALAELDVEEVRPAMDGEAPPGAKGVELAVLGALVVKLARSGKVLGQLVDSVRDWLSRNNAESVRMEIDGDVLEIKGGVTGAERKVLIDAWVQRHGGP